MTPTIFLTGLTAGLLILFFVGTPIFVAFLICNLAAIYLLVGVPGLGMFANSIFDTATSVPLVTLPLFILMGEILSRANAIDQLMKAINILVARVHGRLYLLTVVISTIMAALSGSAMASAAMLGRTVVPQMTSRGYDKSMTLGASIGGACLAPIIPPSVLAILIGTMAQVSIGRLFQAGIVPGLLLSGMFVIYIYARLWINPSLAPREEREPQRSWRDIGTAIAALLPFMSVIGFVMGSIVTGIATPSESAAIGVLGSLGVAAVFRRLSLSMILESLSGTVKVTGMIMAILIASQLFSQLLAFSGTSALMNSMIVGLELPPLLMLAILLLIPFVLCMFMDEIAVMLILIPIYLPLLPHFGFDPLWFFTLFLINISLGAIAPPVGYVLFVLQGVVPNTSLRELFRASIPYVMIFIVALALFSVFPGMITFLN
jgi:tripartite ATP-independent transporter DctM subunit